MPGKRQPGAPVQGIGIDQLTAERRKAIPAVALRIRRFQPGECEVGTLGRLLDDTLPRGNGAGDVALLQAYVAEIEIRRNDVLVELDGCLEAARGLGVIACV